MNSKNICRATKDMHILRASRRFYLELHFNIIVFMRLLIKVLITTLLLLSTSRLSFSYQNGTAISLEHFLVNEKNHRPLLKAISYRVIGVKDGDTIVLLVDGKPLTVRLNHIDCPEKKQDYGSKAKYFVSDRCFDKMITLKHNNKYDRYNRLLAEIILSNGDNLNKELVRNGLAWNYKKYSSDKDYNAIELKARQNKIGIWSYEDPIAPWDWRKKKKK